MRSSPLPTIWSLPSTRWLVISPTGELRVSRSDFELFFSVLKNLIERCIVGVSALELCKIGDDMIVQETDKVYKKDKEITKGVAFPTQANVNNCICHYAPLSSVKNGEYKNTHSQILMECKNTDYGLF